MALSTTDTIAYQEGAPDSSAIKLRDPDMKVDFTQTNGDTYRAVLTLYDSTGNVTGSQAFDLTSTELIAEEAGFAAAMATVKAAGQKAVKTRLLAIPANSGVTITYS